MKKENRAILIPLLCIYLVLLAVFTFMDLPIALRIYHPGTAYAKFFELIGTVPMPIMGVFSSVAFFLFTLQDAKELWKKIILCAVIVINFMYFYFIGAFSIRDAAPALFIPALVLYAGWGVVSYCIARKYMASEQRSVFRAVVMVLFITCAVGVIGEDIIKTLFGRIRFYRLTDPAAEFRPWYVIQSHEFNSSFPSGHAAKAAMPFTVFVLPYLTDKLRSKNSRMLVLIPCSVFMVCTWLARMLDGMHYASDVLTGSMIVLVTFLLCKDRYLDKA